MELDVVDIVKNEIIDKIDTTVKVTEIISSDADTIVFRLCDSKWLKYDNPYLTYNGDPYPDVKVLDDGSISVKNIGMIVKKNQVLNLKQPTFEHGTHRVTNTEWLKRHDDDVRQGVPLIWLLEPITSSRYPQNHAQLKDVNLRLFFLEEIDVNDGTNSEHRRQSVKPMEALAQGFYDAVERSFSIYRNSNTYEKSLSRFGNEDSTGITDIILNANLGGVEIRPTLTISKKAGCKC